MTALATRTSEALAVNGDEPLFSPPPVHALHGLVQYAELHRRLIREVGDFLSGDELRTAFGYYRAAAIKRERHIPDLGVLLDTQAALAALNADCWRRAIRLTDVMDWMPAKRRDELLGQIESHQTPEFDEQTVQSVIVDLLDRRGEFLAEMVEGIFDGLSRRHKTNSPRGFGERMILQYVYNDWGTPSHTGSPSLIHDLRCVVGKLMGRGVPGWGTTSDMLRVARDQGGQWLEIDGGAMRVRGYKVGTAHVEVHQDIAWRLNAILAVSRPHVLANVDRQPPKPSVRRPWRLFERPLPFPVLSVLSSMYIRAADRVVSHSGDDVDRKVLEEVASVLTMIGGISVPTARGIRFEFGYEPADVIREIQATALIPDRVAHQYYPTPDGLANRVVELARPCVNDRVLEPSAGTGALVDAVKRARATTTDIHCVEISDLFAGVLKAKGYNVLADDFLGLSTTPDFDVVVMNPPFSGGRWRAHVEKASWFVAQGGRIVAILPWAKTMPTFDLAPGGWKYTGWHGPYTYPSVSIEVGILVLERDKEHPR